LIRSPPYARHNPYQVSHNDINAWQDQGRQERTFWLLGGGGDYTHFDLDRRAEELQTPAEYVIDSAHGGTEPREKSFLEVTPGNIWVLAIKRAERENAAIVRIQERSGKATDARFKSALLALDHTIHVRPWEMKTLLVRPAEFGNAHVVEVSCLELPGHIAAEKTVKPNLRP
jgi:alpha-mannosidase